METALNGALPPLSYNEREAYAKQVLKTFPLHLFHTVETEGGDFCGECKRISMQ